MADWNTQIIDEFRDNKGEVGGHFQGHLIVLLHHEGAKTGTWRVNPLAAQDLGEGSYAIFASKGGAPTHPDWYFNLVANPEARIEVGVDTIDVKARVADGDERDRIWTKQKVLMPGFAD